MSAQPQAHWLDDGRRLHLNHGPIDLIVEAFGPDDEVRLAYVQAYHRFATMLSELVAELRELRSPADPARPRGFHGPTALRMEASVLPFAGRFVTPMAAVAGAVADEVLAALTAGRRLDRAYVNNGGDIALHLSIGKTLTLAVAGTGRSFADRVEVHARDAVRGVATSGWRGRSHSLGIADAVTVLGRTAAAADAAATMIANAVDLPDHPAIVRIPARDLAPDSDLGERLVTTGVGALSTMEIEEALGRGLAFADACIESGLIAGVGMFLCGNRVVAGSLSLAARPGHSAKSACSSFLRGDTPIARRVSILDLSCEGNRRPTTAAMSLATETRATWRAEPTSEGACSEDPGARGRSP